MTKQAGRIVERWFRAISQILLATVLLLPTLASATPADHGLDMAQDSEAMASIRGTPLSTSTYELLVVREMLRLAHRTDLSMAVDNFLAMRALGQIRGDVVVQEAGTVGDLSAKPPANARPAVDKLLSTAIQSKFVEMKTPWVWVDLVNATQRVITRYQPFAIAEVPGGESVRLNCPVDVQKAIAPGALRRHACNAPFAKDTELERLQRALPAPGSPLAVQSLVLEFEDPPVILDAQGVTWRSSREASDQALKKLNDLSCRAKGTWTETFQSWFEYPKLFFVYAGAAGVIAAATVAFFGAKSGFTAVVAMIAAAVLSLIGALTGPGSHGAGGYGAVILAVYGTMAVVAFVVSFLIALMLFAGLKAITKS